eukprot:Sdes_comp20883_c0_seq4m17916
MATQLKIFSGCNFQGSRKFICFGKHPFCPFSTLVEPEKNIEKKDDEEKKPVQQESKEEFALAKVLVQRMKEEFSKTKNEKPKDESKSKNQAINIEYVKSVADLKTIQSFGTHSDPKTFLSPIHEYCGEKITPDLNLKDSEYELNFASGRKKNESVRKSAMKNAFENVKKNTNVDFDSLKTQLFQDVSPDGALSKLLDFPAMIEKDVMKRLDTLKNSGKRILNFKRFENKTKSQLSLLKNTSTSSVKDIFESFTGNPLPEDIFNVKNEPSKNIRQLYLHPSQSSSQPQDDEEEKPKKQVSSSRKRLLKLQNKYSDVKSKDFEAAIQDRNSGKLDLNQEFYPPQNTTSLEDIAPTRSKTHPSFSETDDFENSPPDQDSSSSSPFSDSSSFAGKYFKYDLEEEISSSRKGKKLYKQGKYPQIAAKELLKEDFESLTTKAKQLLMTKVPFFFLISFFFCFTKFRSQFSPPQLKKSSQEKKLAPSVINKIAPKYINQIQPSPTNHGSQRSIALSHELYKCITSAISKETTFSDIKQSPLEIVRVSLTPDLRFATVFWECTLSDSDHHAYVGKCQELQTTLLKYKSGLRSHIARKLNMKYTPEIDFASTRDRTKELELEKLLSDISSQ